MRWSIAIIRLPHWRCSQLIVAKLDAGIILSFVPRNDFSGGMGMHDHTCHPRQWQHTSAHMGLPWNLTSTTKLDCTSVLYLFYSQVCALHRKTIGVGKLTMCIWIGAYIKLLALNINAFKKNSRTSRDMLYIGCIIFFDFVIKISIFPSYRSQLST